MTYKTEFPDYELDVLIPVGFEDDSWHNDVMPKWINPQLNLALWINYPEAEKREGHEKNRFYLYEIDNNGDYVRTILVGKDNEYDLILMAILEKLLANRGVKHASKI